MIINEPRHPSGSLTWMRRFIPILVLVALAACGGTSNAPTGPTAATVAVQASDVPKDMIRCDLSGDIQNFIQKEQGPDPSTSKSAANEWSHAQKNGATAAYTAIYTDSKSHCTDFASGRNDPAAVPYRLVIDFVLQFKDEKSAATTYTNDSIFGVTASSLSASGSSSILGMKSGLTANSVVVSQSLSNQTFYIALWQNKTFDVFLAVLNFDPAAAKKVATSENSRIK
ncbi:MAG TPA: hypothetical protein VGX22_14225 [Candidatus Dormibacteraeota bacterium]|nr:hypothetical protein [Candidatus Dormibacteraeota bacterium]